MASRTLLARLPAASVGARFFADVAPIVTPSVAHTASAHTPSTLTPPALGDVFRAASTPPPRRQVGAVRGGIIGLLIGFVVSGVTGYYYLLDDYQVYSNTLLSNVEKLGLSVDNVQTQISKVASLEAEVKALKNQAVRQDELERLRREMLKMLDAATVETLELKTRVWGLENVDGRAARI